MNPRMPTRTNTTPNTRAIVFRSIVEASAEMARARTLPAHGAASTANARRAGLPTQVFRRGSLAELDGRQGHGGQHRADEPEPDDDLRLRPALALEVVVQRGHEEDPAAFAVALLRVLEPADLQDHAHCFGDEDAADENEHEFLADHDRDVADEPAERQ